MKFVPHYTGKQQTMTYDTVKDHIIQQIQKTYKYGLDMAKMLREMEYNQTPGGTTPIRKVVTIKKNSDIN